MPLPSTPPRLATAHRRALCGLLVALASSPAWPAVQAHRLCPEIEPRPDRRAPLVCYAGVPCIIGLRGEGLEFVASASAVSAARTSVTSGSVLSTGEGGSPPAAHCVPPASGAYAAVRLPAIEQAGAYVLVLQRTPRLGIARSDEQLALQVVPSHGFLNPRQLQASEQARRGEAQTFTLTGHLLGGLRVRADAAGVMSGEGAVRPDVQWMSPDQSQVRIRLTLHRAGPVPMNELFEFIGSGESPVNRDLGWPVINVVP